VSNRPPRIPGFSYLGFHRYSLTICVNGRERVFTAPTIVDEAREQISHAATTRGFAIPVYCFMPDHLHVLVEGQADNSELIRFANLLKQRTSFVYQRNRPDRLWQKGYFEHVLRDDEVTRGGTP